MKRIQAEHLHGIINKLSAGEVILLSGTIYSARDAALNLLEKEKVFPKFLNGSIIYHAGPTEVNSKGFLSCGPTTSSRMDKYLEMLFKNKVEATIGKGERDVVVHKKFRRIYLAAIGGCGAVYGRKITGLKSVMYENLGSEAIFQMTVEHFPLIVAIDIKGNTIY